MADDTGNHGLDGKDEGDFMRLCVSEDEAAEFNGIVAEICPKSVAASIQDPKLHGLDSSNRRLAEKPINTDVEMADVRDAPHANVSAVEFVLGPDELVQNPTNDLPKDGMAQLYRSLNMDLEATSLLLVTKYRLDSIHIRGVEEMSTQDVMNFFQGCKPQKVEWVNDTSCNVVFSDDSAAAFALKSVSFPLLIRKKSSDPSVSTSEPPPPLHDSHTGEEVLVSDVASFPIPVPSGYWRVAKTPPTKTKQLIFRYARTIDKKPQHAQKFSQYYAKYGNPNTSLIESSSRKRTALGTYKTAEREDHEPFGLFVERQMPVESDNDYYDIVAGSDGHDGRGFYGNRHEGTPYSRPRMRDDLGINGYHESGSDLRSLLQDRNPHLMASQDRPRSLSTSDLRNRLSQPNINPVVRNGESDLRARLNKMRRTGSDLES